MRVARRNVGFAMLAAAVIKLSVAPGRNAKSGGADIAAQTIGVCHASTVPLCLRPVCQPEAGQRHPREANAEFLQRRAA
jgi:hypothetical protein